jgi:phosphoribosyl 1,2-cyclic phosphodiesterase
VVEYARFNYNILYMSRFRKRKAAPFLQFCSLFSGSSGNAVYLATERGGLLIDCGMSGKLTLEAMARVGLSPASVHAILITHEHSDHIRGAGVLCRKLGVPLYATEGTWEGMAAAVGDVASRNRVIITAGESFFLEDLEVVPFSIPHDASDPVGFRFFFGKHSVAVATDLGYFSQVVSDAVSGSDIVLLESNHDPELLRKNPHYSAQLKTRILGKKGHLSNDAGAEAAVRLAQCGTRHVLLGHLSSENNTPEIAYRTAHAALTSAGADVGKEVTLHVAGRFQASCLYRI